MDNVRRPRGAPGGQGERDDEERQQQDAPRRCPEVLDDPVAVGDPEVAEVGRRDDVDLDPRVSQMGDASATKLPAGSPGVRGYDVVRTQTRT